MPTTPEAHEFYTPNTDAVKTETRLQGIIDGSTPVTPRALFEATADTFASSLDGEDDWEVADESVSQSPVHVLHAAYYRADEEADKVYETAYLQAYAGNDYKGPSFSFEFNLLKNGVIETVIDDQEVDFEEPIEVTPELGIFVGSILLEGLLGSHQSGQV